MNQQEEIRKRMIAAADDPDILNRTVTESAELHGLASSTVILIRGARRGKPQKRTPDWLCSHINEKWADDIEEKKHTQTKKIFQLLDDPDLMTATSLELQERYGVSKSRVTAARSIVRGEPRQYVCDSEPAAIEYWNSRFGVNGLLQKWPRHPGMAQFHLEREGLRA